jgi:PEP-CTERM motif
MSKPKMWLLAVAALAVVALAGGVPTARADSIGGINNINCPGNDCFGTLYTLTTNGLVSSTATTQTWQVELALDTTNTTFGSGVFIDAVAIKISSSASAVSLISAPGGTSAWAKVQLGGLNAKGCDGSGSGFFCTEDGSAVAASPATLPFAGTYSWVFDVTIPTGTLDTSAFGSSIKVLYTDLCKVGHKPLAECNVGITSEDITLQGGPPPPPTPEPATLMTLGSGLLALGGIFRRRMRTGG